MKGKNKKETEKLDYKIIETISKIEEIKKITDNCTMPKIQYNSITRG